MDENEQFTDKKELISAFNEAKFQMVRLNYLWSRCNYYSQSGNLDNWKWALDTVARELSPDIKEMDRDKDERKKALVKLNLSIAEAKNQESMYTALQEKEIYLRCIQDEVGKGSKRISIDEDEIDN